MQYTGSARVLRYLGEVVGTFAFLLVILVFGGLTFGAFAVGLALAVMILAFGWFGSYAFNPAVATMLAVEKNTKEEYTDLPFIIIAEFIGAFAAFGMSKWARGLGYAFPTDPVTVVPP